MYDDVEDIDFDIKEKIDQTISKIAKLEAKKLRNVLKNYDLKPTWNYVGLAYKLAHTLSGRIEKEER